MTEGRASSLGYAGLRFGPFSSNLFLYMQVTDHAARISPTRGHRGATRIMTS